MKQILKNNLLTVEIDSLGTELQSIVEVPFARRSVHVY